MPACLTTEQSQFHPQGRRRGFTAIELLVVVSVIGVLAGLLIPATQAAREAMRRVQCVSNLKQIGLAMSSYYAHHNMFPPGFLFLRPGIVDNYSELTFLLPQLEQQPLMSSINFSFNSIESPETPTLGNRTARNTRIAAFLCPSDGEKNHLNSYRFNRGCWGASRIGYFDGPFSFGVLPTGASISDGLSNTAFVSERLGGSFAAASSGDRDVKFLSEGYVVITDDEFIPVCLEGRPEKWAKASGRYWMLAGFYNANYNHNGGPNDPRPSCGPGLTNLGYGLHPPRSYHPGVVNVLLGDGRVRAVSDGITPATWQAMGTHSAGDLYTE